MQSIINKNGFGFCQTSGFRNCINCSYRLMCINYIPVYLNNIKQIQSQEVYSIQNLRLSNDEVVNDASIVSQENIVLKQKIQDLETEILQIKKNENTEENNQKQVIQAEENSTGLQVYNKNTPEAYQQNNTPLRAKKGIFGTKYVEEKPKGK